MFGFSYFCTVLSKYVWTVPICSIFITYSHHQLGLLCLYQSNSFKIFMLKPNLFKHGFSQLTVSVVQWLQLMTSNPVTSLAWFWCLGNSLLVWRRGNESSTGCSWERWVANFVFTRLKYCCKGRKINKQTRQTLNISV